MGGWGAITAYSLNASLREALFWHLGLALTNLSLAIYVCYTARFQSHTVSKIILQMKGKQIQIKKIFQLSIERRNFDCFLKEGDDL